MRATIVSLVMALLACSPSVESEPVEETGQDDEPGTTRRTLEELPPMPDYPIPQRGKLVVISDGDFSVDGAWQAAAGFCQGGILVELYAEGDSAGAVIVLQHPEGDLAGEYTVVLADSSNPDQREARIGAQVLRGREGFGLQALMGSLEVTQAGDRISGRFSSTLRELNIGVLTRFVGIFDDVRLSQLAEDYCRELYQDQEPETEPDSSMIRDVNNGMDQE